MSPSIAAGTEQQSSCRGQRVYCALWTGGALLVYLVYCATTFNGIRFYENDAMYYADVARNIADGRGFVAHAIYSEILALVNQTPSPVIARGVLWPWLLSFWFRLFGASDFTTVAFTGILFVVSVPLFWRISLNLFGNAIATVAAVLFMLDNTVLHYATSGLSESLYVLLFLAVVWCLVQSPSRRTFLGAGLLLGLCELTREITLIYLLPLTLWTFFTTQNSMSWRGRLQQPGLFLLGFLLAVSPMLWLDARTTGSPFFHFLRTLSYSGNVSLYNMLSSQGSSQVLTDVSHSLLSFSRLENGYVRFFEQYRRFFELTSGFLLAFALVGLLRPGQTPQQRRFRGVVVVLLGVQVLANCFVHWEVRFFFPLLPLLIVMAALELWERVQAWESAHTSRLLRPLGVGALVFFFTLPTYETAIHEARTRSQTESHPPFAGFREFLHTHLHREVVLASNAINPTAWYGGFPCLGLPEDPSQMRSLLERTPVDAIVLCELGEMWHISEPWRDACSSGYIPFSHLATFDNGTLRAVLFRYDPKSL